MNDENGERVAELEATVDGLTEEVVELTERVRLLEAELEPATQGGDRPEAVEQPTNAVEPGEEIETGSEGVRSEETESDSETADPDDIIVA